MGEDPECRPHHRYALADGERPSRGVYLAVAEARGCSPLDVPPLADAIDPDALDRLLLAADGLDAIAFSYCGYEVEVTEHEVRVSAGDG